MAEFILAGLLFIGICLYFFTQLEYCGSRQQAVIALLMVVGVTLVLFADAVGSVFSPHGAEADTNAIRDFGILSFIAGAAERIVLVVRGPQSAEDAPVV